LSAMFTLALFAPGDVGRNCKPTKQEVFGLRLLTPRAHGEPLVGGTNANWGESVPVSAIDVMFNGVEPVLLICRLVVALIAPTARLLNCTLGLLRVTAGAAPVPVRPTVCGLPDALSVTLRLALFDPAEVGLNCRPRKQELAALTLIPAEHVGEPLVGVARMNCDRSVPASAIEVILNVAVPEFVICTLVVALVVPTN
jgi:hypothetical protein